VLGNGLLTSEGDFWLRQRRLIQPVFQRERLASYAPDMTAYTQRQIDTWRDGEERDLHIEMRQLTLAIAAKTLFGADVTGQSEAVGLALHEAMGTFSQRFFRILRIPERIPTPGNLRIRRAVRRLDAILYGLINQRRAEGEQKDLLSILLHARHESDGTGMTDQQLRDEAMTLFLAGHETTALALTWSLYLLGLDPATTARVRAEIAAVAPAAPLGTIEEVRDRQDVAIGRRGLRALLTPGHTQGGVSYLADGFVVTGDVLFVGGCGRTDFTGGDTAALWRSLQRLAALPEETRVYPGHNYGTTATSTIGREREENRLLLCKTFEEFKALREKKRA